MAYSNSYEFKNVQIVEIIRDAYRLVFSNPAPMTADDLKSSRISLNLILASWANRGINLWAVSRNNLLTLNPGQAEYNLSDNIVDVLEVSTRTFVRQLSGTAFSSSGVAADAFDGNVTTACTQDAADGYIGYNYGSSVIQSITMFGLTSFNDNAYTIDIQCSLNQTTYDNNEWVTFLSLPLTQFYDQKVQWFNIETPAFGQYFRIKENGGATLNINEVYFNGQVNDMVVQPDSRSNYITYNNKYQISRPSIYIFNRQIDIPSITLWPTPSVDYPCLLYNYSYQIQDIGALYDTPYVPPSFYLALRDALAYELSKKSPGNVSESKMGILKNDSEISFKLAAQENREKYVPLNFSFSMSDYQV